MSLNHAMLSLVPIGLAAPAIYMWWRERRLRLATEERLRKSEAYLVETQKLARIGTWEFNIETDQIRWSEETFRIFDLPAGNQEPDFADVLLGIHPEDAPIFDRAIQRAISAHEPYRLDLRIHTAGGKTKHIHAQGTPVPGADGQVERILGTVLDISERKEAECRLEQEATYDTLTGLFNRRHLMAQLEREIEIANRDQSPLTFCICDLDRFKNVNDTYSHLTGDELLTEFGKVLTEEVRRGDIPGRIGGDEFGVIFPRTLPPQARIGVERIRERLQNRVFTTSDGRKFQATATFGLAQLQPGADPRALIGAADAALYQAKQHGRNQSDIAC